MNILIHNICLKPSLQLLSTKIIRPLSKLQGRNICLLLASLWVINLLYRVKDGVSNSIRNTQLDGLPKISEWRCRTCWRLARRPSVIGTSEQLTSGAPLPPLQTPHTPHFTALRQLNSIVKDLFAATSITSRICSSFVLPRTIVLYFPDVVKLWTKNWCARLVQTATNLEEDVTEC